MHTIFYLYGNLCRCILLSAEGSLLGSLLGQDEYAQKCVSVNHGMLQLSLLALDGSARAVFRPHYRAVQRDEFIYTALWAWGSFVYALFRLFDDYLLKNNPAYAFALAAGLGLRLFLWFIEAAMTVLHGFVMRRVHWWFWLPKNGASKEFDSVWSQVLFFIVFVGAPILSYNACLYLRLNIHHV
ncbi:hypothetical protein SODALDRAFT_328548, partial [Sodiomyces alkalinus F11]